jgi:Arc/MetJ-type ribon-helix-helix transcriptional regulator
MTTTAINARLPKHVVQWIDGKIRAGIFVNRTNAIVTALLELIAQYDEPQTKILEDGVVSVKITYRGDATFEGIEVL